MKKSSPQADLCPCGSGAIYASCCGRWHAGPLRLQAPDAAALMRSRYSAFVRNDLAYLLDTWHPSTRPATLEPNPTGLQWLGLQVRRHEQSNADTATVEFVARSRLNGRANRLHETSRFVREQGRWLYIDGQFHD
ncbi:MAG TPA: YchJ family metal-binding protein [Alcaligenes sp.]|nr:YchJ family metal-binding protein [Alcaligenes sp.]HRL28508.1 YchJ family metal-binding protein [Alcaligenes sp.]